MKRGFLYIATGRRFLDEAYASAKRVRALMPDFPLAVASDFQPEGDLFAHWLPVENPRGTFADKIPPLASSPFEETVFLDTDTYLCTAVPELFDLLGRCDLAMAHAPMRHTAKVPVPDSFPEFNSGVMGYRLNERVRGLFERWQHIYEERLAATGQPDDQPALRQALWESEVQLGVLPPEYNFRFVLPTFAGRGPVRILHGRHTDFEGLAARINGSASPRVFLPQLRDANARHFGILSAPGRTLAWWVALDAWCARWLGKAWDGFKARIPPAA